jgi:sortase A
MNHARWRRYKLNRLARFVAASLALVGVWLSTYAYVGHVRSIPDQVDEVSSDLDRFALSTAGNQDPLPQKWIVQRIVAQAKATVVYDPYPRPAERIGTVTFPDLDLSWPIFQGTSDPELARGVGHYLTSVLPGEEDNAVLAGHRETVFNRLDELKLGQKINVSTSAGVFQYKIKKFRVVQRTDRSVIVPTPHAVLTLVTCYPINFVGTTHQSYVVSADLVSSRLRQP